MADDALMAAGVAIDALFEFINADKLKLVRVVEKPTMAPSFDTPRRLLTQTAWLVAQADLFTRIDRDRSGTLEREELEMCLTSAYRTPCPACRHRARSLFAHFFRSQLLQCWALLWSRLTWMRS